MPTYKRHSLDVQRKLAPFSGGFGAWAIAAWKADISQRKEVNRITRFAICGVAALLLVLTVVSTYASLPDYFYREKVCSDPDCLVCDLQSANPFADLNGG
jgi:hypothetical protein